MSIRNFGVLAIASVAAAVGHDAHHHAHLHARGTGAPAPAESGLPSCWGACFEQYGVESPEAACDSKDVSKCIKEACATAEAVEYESWRLKKCGAAAPYPIPGSNTTAAAPTGAPSTSLCTETSTLIYHSTTDYSTYVVTHTSSAGGEAPGASDVPVTPEDEDESSPAPGGYGDNAPSGKPSDAPAGTSPAGDYGSPSGTHSSPVPTDAGEEECVDVTVTETERTTVTITAGNGGAPSSDNAVPTTYDAPAAPSSQAPNSDVPAAPAPSPDAPASEVPAPAPSSYEAPKPSAPPAAPSNDVTEADAATEGSPAPSSYEAPKPEEPKPTAPAAPESYKPQEPSSPAAPKPYESATSASAPKPSSGGSGSTPGHWKGKRGVGYDKDSVDGPGGVPEALLDGKHIGWAMTWQGVTFDAIPADFPFIPTLHDGRMSDIFAPVFKEQCETAVQNGAEYIFGQNEPDMPDQANQTPKEAADTWRDLIEPFAGRAKLCAPSVTNSPAGSGLGLDWLTEFMKECSDCTIDCVNQHWYSDEVGVDHFEKFKKQVDDISKFNKPVFVGEFGAPTPNGVATEEEKSAFLEKVMPWMDENPKVVGYAYFKAADGYLNNGASLSAHGETYCNAD